MTTDFTVAVVLDAETSRMVDYERFNRTDWAVQRQRLVTLAQKWGVSSWVVESNSAGSPNIEELQRAGHPVRGFNTTAQSKPKLIEDLVLAFDRRQIQILDDATFKTELALFKRHVSLTGRSQYRAPDGMHDDCVIALALAYYAISTSATIGIVEW
jgi:hypothetical protein